LKWAGLDAIQPFCGFSADLCTPERIGNHLGLTVPERPVDIVFETVRNTTATVAIINNRSVEMNASNPRAFRCYESYHFEDIEYGDKCSCTVGSHQQL
jgi:hypothetical protein